MEAKFRRQRQNSQSGGETRLKMHAGEASNGSGQRANEDKFHATTVETTMPAEKRDEKCTPVREERQRPACKKEEKSPLAASRRPIRRRNKIKNARR